MAGGFWERLEPPVCWLRLTSWADAVSVMDGWSWWWLIFTCLQQVLVLLLRCCWQPWPLWREYKTYLRAYALPPNAMAWEKESIGGIIYYLCHIFPSMLCLHSVGEALDLHLLGTHGTCGYAGFPRHHLWVRDQPAKKAANHWVPEMTRGSLIIQPEGGIPLKAPFEGT